MGIVLGLTAGVCFSIASIFARFGMRLRERDDGLFMSVLVNLLILGALTLLVDMPAWDGTGVAALAVGGVLGTFGGRWANLRAIRLIGPSRANALLTGGPLVAAIGGWFVLDESISLLSGVGGAMVLFGIFRIVRSRTTAQTIQSLASSPPASTPPNLEKKASGGFAIALLAPVLFGLAFVVRKWGLDFYPTAVGGAFIGAVAGMSVQLLMDISTGQLGRRVSENLVNVPWLFVGAGLFTSAALLSQFFAFQYLPAWVVSLLQGTQVLWTLLIASIVLRREERIDASLILSIIIVFVGVAAITVQY